MSLSPPHPTIPSPRQSPFAPSQTGLAQWDRWLTAALFMAVLGAFSAAYFTEVSNVGETAASVPWFLTATGCGVVFALSLVLLVGTRRQRLIQGSLWIMAFLIGALYYQGAHFKPGPDDIGQWLKTRDRPSLSDIQGEVVRREKDGGRGVIAVHQVDGEARRGQVQIWRSAQPLPPLGSWIQAQGQLNTPRSSLFPGGFDEATYLRHHHITSTLSKIRAIDVLNAQPMTLQSQWFQWMETQRSRIMGVFGLALPKPMDGILGGIVLGSHAVSIEKEVQQAFANTGLIHYLAASGLNVGIVAGLFVFLERLFPLHWRIPFLLGMVGAGFYIVLAGLSPSVVRAGVMLEIAFALKCLNRSLQPLLLLAIAVVSLLLFNPDWVMDLGFQLSVLSTFGILISVPPLEKCLKPYLGSFVATLILVPLVAQLWVSPILMATFHQLPVHSVLLNLLSWFLVTPLTLIGFVAAGLSFLSEPIAQGLAALAQPLMMTLMALVRWGNEQQWALLQVPTLPRLSLIALWGILLYGSLWAMTVWIWERTTLEQKSLWPRVRNLVSLCLVIAFVIPLFVSRWQGAHTETWDWIPLNRHHWVWVYWGKQTQTPLVVSNRPLYEWKEQQLAQYLSREGATTVSFYGAPYKGHSKPANLQEASNRHGFIEGILATMQKHYHPIGDRGYGWQLNPVGLVETLPETEEWRMTFYDAAASEPSATEFSVQSTIQAANCIRMTQHPKMTFECPISILFGQPYPRLMTQNASQWPVPLKGPTRFTFSPHEVKVFRLESP